MRKYFFFFLPFLVIAFFVRPVSGTFWAIGIDDPKYVGRHFDVNELIVRVVKAGGLITVEVEAEYTLVQRFYSLKQQDYELIGDFTLPDNAVIIECGILEEGGWRMAGVVDVLTAETVYNQTGQQNNRLLLRKRMVRDYYGEERSSYRLQLSPIRIGKPFRFRFKYLAPVYPAIWYMYTFLPIWQFYVWDYRKTPLHLYFRDLDNPDARAILQAGVASAPHPFQQLPDGSWYLRIDERELWSSSLVLFFWHPLPHLYEFRSFADENGSYFHMMIRPPLSPGDAPARHILLVYDLTEDLAPGYSISGIWGNMEMALRAGLFDTDSVNVLLMDFVPKFLRNSFVPATSENITRLLKELKNIPQPKVSSLPQLLRTAVRYFNEKGKGGEIWLFTTAKKHSKPVSVANNILDLTARQLQVPVSFRILDCSAPDWRDRITINGVRYDGNDYLYENLARLSNGKVSAIRRTAVWNLSFVLQDLFFPAVDEVEVKFQPQGGIPYGEFLLHRNRTHFPLSFPYVVLGKFTGDPPFAVDYFGHLSNRLFHKRLVADSLLSSPANEWLAVYWHASYCARRLVEPQSHALIDEIGQVSVRYGFLSPYSGFVIPGPSGFSGFRRLSADDDPLEQQESEAQVPDQFRLNVYPNPFRTRLQVAVHVGGMEEERQGKIMIFNLIGQKVMESTLNIPPGQPVVFWKWDGRGFDGVPLPSGIYVIQVMVGRTRKATKVTFLR